MSKKLLTSFHWVVLAAGHFRCMKWRFHYCCFGQWKVCCVYWVGRWAWWEIFIFFPAVAKIFDSLWMIGLKSLMWQRGWLWDFQAHIFISIVEMCRHFESHVLMSGYGYEWPYRVFVEFFTLFSSFTLALGCIIAALRVLDKWANQLNKPVNVLFLKCAARSTLPSHTPKVAYQQRLRSIIFCLECDTCERFRDLFLPNWISYSFLNGILVA